MTAGADGVVHYWDYEARNKIKTLNYGQQPVCASVISPKGDMMAYALGNDWHLGQEGINKWPTKVGVHPITENETRFAK
jgi:mRNA export factor